MTDDSRAIALLISPEARGAYFKAYREAALAELQQLLGATPTTLRSVGPLDFLELDCAADTLPQLARLSFVQGLFEIHDQQLLPLDVTGNFNLHEDFVFGSKYRGKTNERLTQQLLNLGLAAIGASPGDGIKLLDPMCGRATTLLWAMRYGIRARGIEQDPAALGDIRQSLKKWSKLHRQKHSLREGSVGKASKKSEGRFLEYQTGDLGMKVITGDAQHAPRLLGGEKFNLIVSDLPYGVQHHASTGQRNPLELLQACAPAWVQCLQPGGAMVLAFNNYQPKRAELIEVFREQGLAALPFASPHRMSESILRDIVILAADA